MTSNTRSSKKKYFSLLEILLTLSIIVILVTTAVSSMPALELYRFKKNQKKICHILHFCYLTARTNHLDVIVKMNNEKKSLTVNICSEEKGALFFKDKERTLLIKNFFLKDQKTFEIRFSATGWVFPLHKPLHFVDHKEREVTIDLKKIFHLEWIEKETKETLYLTQ